MCIYMYMYIYVYICICIYVTCACFAQYPTCRSAVHLLSGLLVDRPAMLRKSCLLTFLENTFFK